MACLISCSISGCSYVASHTHPFTPHLKIELCEYHWTMLQQEQHDRRQPSVFADKLKSIDEGRFSKLIEALVVEDECFNCFYLNPKITDPGLGYRCYSAGSCIAATLSNEIKSYLFWKLDEITEEQHMRNANENQFFKIGG